MIWAMTWNVKVGVELTGKYTPRLNGTTALHHRVTLRKSQRSKGGHLLTYQPDLTFMHVSRGEFSHLRQLIRGV